MFLFGHTRVYVAAVLDATTHEDDKNENVTLNVYKHTRTQPTDESASIYIMTGISISRRDN